MQHRGLRPWQSDQGAKTTVRLPTASALILIVATITACAPGAVPTPTPSASPVLPAVTASASAVLPSITLQAAIAVTKPGWVVVDGTSLVVFSTNGEISRIDPATNDISAPTMVDAAWNGGGFALNDAGLWVGDFDANLVYRIDRTSLTVVATIPVPLNPAGAGATADAVWIANHRGGTVTRIDPATNKVVATVKVSNVGRSGPHAIGFGLGSVWVSAGNSGTVVRIDPETNKIQATIPIPSNASACGGFTFTNDAVWMPSCWDAHILVRIDPATDKVVAAIDLGGYGGEPVLIDEALWLTTRKSDDDPARLVRIDQASNTIDRVLSLGEKFGGESLVVAFGSVWTPDWSNNQVIRVPLAAFNV